jgi:hypothetical protein
MRRHRAFPIAFSLCLLPAALGGGGAAAAAQVTRPSPAPERQFVLEATYVCGMTDGKFGCRYAPGDVAHGKNAIPGATNANPPEEAPQATPGDQGASAPAGNPAQGAQPGVTGEEVVKPGEHACPPGYRVLAAPTAAGYCEPVGTPAAGETCQHGMVGMPPSNCHCPPSSELLGGNCVHYRATCSQGLAADFTPQPCAGAEEKLACKMRQDGLKDCCCLTYDK